jgi:glycosyltransferase involved in cell wall biosynthesis
MPQKLITFAVPCYNSADYMDKCVRSLLAGGSDIEIILVDDGSTKDDTPAICDRYAAEHPDIVKVIHRPRRRGQPGPAPRLRGLLQGGGFR